MRVVGAVKAVVAIRMEVVVRAIEGEEKRHMGADVGRSALTSPLEKK